MTTFDESEHPREGDGKFVGKHQAAARPDAFPSGETPAEVFLTLVEQQRELTRHLHEAAIETLRDEVRREYPQAAYFTMDRSDEGSFMQAGGVYSANGEYLGDLKDEHSATWQLDDGPDLPDYWSKHTIAHPADKVQSSANALAVSDLADDRSYVVAVTR